MYTFNKSKFITFLVLSYTASIVLNASGILSTLGMDLWSKIVNYLFPAAAFMGVCCLKWRTKISEHRFLYIALIAFLSSYFIIGLASSLYYNHFEELYGIITGYINCLFGLCIIILFLRNSSIENNIYYFKGVSLLFMLAGISIPLLYYLGFEMRGYELDYNLSENNLRNLFSRPSGIDGNANNASIRANIGMMFSLFWINKSRRLSNKVFFLLIFCALSIAVFMTFSNTGMISAIAIIVVFHYKFNYRNGINVKLMVAFVALFFIVFPLLLINLNIDYSKIQKQKIENIVNILMLDINEVDYSMRDTKVASSFVAIRKNPITGQGIGVFRNRYSSHNTFLMIIGDSGVFALLMYLFLLVLCVIYGLKRRGDPMAFLIMAWAVLIGLNSMANHNIITRIYILLPLLLFIFIDNEMRRKWLP